MLAQRDQRGRHDGEGGPEGDLPVLAPILGALVDTQQRRAIVGQAHQQDERREHPVGLLRPERAPAEGEQQNARGVEQAAAQQQVRERTEQPESRSGGRRQHERRPVSHARAGGG